MPYKVGDIVTPNPDAGWAKRIIGARYKITDVPRGARGVNYKATPCDADGNTLPGQGLRGPEWALLSADTLDNAIVTLEDSTPNPPVGSIVLSEGPSRPKGFYTVIGETDATRVRIVQIGDVSGRYYRAASNTLTVLDPKSVIDALDAFAMEI